MFLKNRLDALRTKPLRITAVAAIAAAVVDQVAAAAVAALHSVRDREVMVGTRL